MRGLSGVTAEAVRFCWSFVRSRVVLRTHEDPVLES